MSFDGITRTRASVKSAIDNEHAALLAAVAASHGRSATPVREVYTTSEVADPVTPCVIIGGVEATVNDQGAITSDITVTLMHCVSGADPVALVEQMEDHLTATVRLFSRTTRDGIKFSVTRFASDEPGPWPGADLLHTGAVQLAAKVVDAPG